VVAERQEERVVEARSVRLVWHWVVAWAPVSRLKVALVEAVL
jgi:hypothetical protein